MKPLQRESPGWNRPTVEPERAARAAAYAKKFPAFLTPDAASKQPAKGQTYESRRGMTFTVVALDRRNVTVSVQRTTSKNGRPTIDVHERIVPRALFDTFARAYKEAT